MKSYSNVEADKVKLLTKHFTPGRGGKKIQYVTRHHTAGVLDTNGVWTPTDYPQGWRKL